MNAARVKPQEARERIAAACVKLTNAGWTMREIGNALDGLQRDEMMDKAERLARTITSFQRQS